MATTSRVTPDGWQQADDAADYARVTPEGWDQQKVAPAVPTVTALLRQRSQFIGSGLR